MQNYVHSTASAKENRMTGPRRFISQAEFERASARSRMTPATLKLVHCVLVKGAKQIDVAKKAKVTRAWINEAVKKFMRCIDEVERLSLPAGWEADTVALPPDLWPKVRNLERAARAGLKKTATKKVIPSH